MKAITVHEARHVFPASEGRHLGTPSRVVAAAAGTVAPFHFNYRPIIRAPQRCSLEAQLKTNPYLF